MTSPSNHQSFGSLRRVSQSLRSDRCQTVLYKAVFEHFTELPRVAALLLSSKSFQNSSFGADFLVNYVVDENTISLVESVLSPTSCFSLQFVPSLRINQSGAHSEKIHRGFSNWASEMINTKYLHLSLRSLWLERVNVEVLSTFFGSSMSNAWPQLNYLALEGSGVDDANLRIISKNAAQLRTVNFSGNAKITGAGFEHLSTLPNISFVNLSYCCKFTDAGLEHLSELSGINSLNLDSCKEITDVGLQHISGLSGITDLNLSACSLITDAGLEHISQLSGLTSLSLSHCYEITDAGLEQVAKSSGITSLDLRCCELISDAGLKYLSTLSSITSLDLRFCCEITNAGLEHISKLSNITSLSLYGCTEVKDEAKQQLKTALRQWRE